MSGTADQDALVAGLARATVERAAPEELPLFGPDQRGLLRGSCEPRARRRRRPHAGVRRRRGAGARHPGRALGRKGGRGFIVGQVRARLKDEGEGAVQRTLDRIFDRGAPRDTGEPKPPELSDEQLERVRALALEKAEQLKLPTDEGAASGRLARRQPRDGMSAPAAADAEAPAAPQSLRVPVRHDLPLRPARRRRARLDALRVGLDLLRRRRQRSALRGRLVGGLPAGPAATANLDEYTSGSERLRRVRPGGNSPDGVVDARRRCPRPAPRRRAHPAPAVVEAAADAPAAFDGGRRAGRGRDGTATRRRGRAARAADTGLGPARRRADRARLRPCRPLHGRADGRPRRPRDDRSRGLSRRSPARARAHLGTATSISPTSRSRSGTRSCSGRSCRSRSRSSTRGSTPCLRVGWRVAALALLVYLTRNAILRSREVYADVRASAAPGAADALARLLAALPRPRTTGLSRLVRVHPDPSARLAAMLDTGPLFRLDLFTAFGAGIAATIAYESAVEPRLVVRQRPRSRCASSPRSRSHRRSSASSESQSGGRASRSWQTGAARLRPGRSGSRWPRE